VGGLGSGRRGTDPADGHGRQRPWPIAADSSRPPGAHRPSITAYRAPSPAWPAACPIAASDSLDDCSLELPRAQPSAAQTPKLDVTSAPSINITHSTPMLATLHYTRTRSHCAEEATHIGTNATKFPLCLGCAYQLLAWACEESLPCADTKG
jgi:hypothetical protein